MSLTRKFLSNLGIDDEKVDLIISEHVNVTDSLKAESEGNSKKYADVQKQLDEANKKLSDYEKQLATADTKISEFEKDDFKSKYESKVQELETLKSEYTAKETAVKKKNTLSAQLKSLGYSDTATRLIVNRSDFADKIEIGEDGKATNIDSVITEIQSDSDFSGFTPKKEDSAHIPSNPPANTGGTGGMTKEKIMEIRNTAERQKAIAENPELFGLS